MCFSSPEPVVAGNQVTEEGKQNLKEKMSFY